jgi:hypothetical protein
MKLLNGNLREMGHRKLALCAVGTADNIRKGDTLAATLRELRWWFDVGFHGGKSRRVVLQRQAPDARQVVARREWAQTR